MILSGPSVAWDAYHHEGLLIIAKVRSKPIRPTNVTLFVLLLPLHTNGVARATPPKKSATPSLRLQPHHLAPHIGLPRVMRAPAMVNERTHGQKVPAEARNGHKIGRVKQEA